MPYGFRVLRADGSIVVDDSSFVHTVVGTDNSNAYPQALSSGNVRGPIPQQDDELLFCEPSLNSPFFFGVAFNVFGLVMTEDLSFVRARPYYTVSPPPNGLAVFNESGQATFHTGSPLIRVLNSHSQFIPAGNSPNPVNVGISADTTHIAMTSSTGAVVPVPPFPTALVFGAQLNRTSATNVEVLFGNPLGQTSIGATNPIPIPVTVSFITARIL